MPPTDYLLEAATEHYRYGYAEFSKRHGIYEGRKLSRFAQAIMPGLDQITTRQAIMPQLIIDIYNKNGK
jgi:hypothetical protein